jgi:hypothetical protein
MINMRIVIISYTLLVLWIGAMIGFGLAVVIGILKNKSEFE